MAFQTIRFVFAALALSVLTACSSAGPVGNPRVPEPLKQVELDRYLGKWYEIARYENRFEKGCEGVTAEYSKNEDDTIKVINTCYDDSPEGKMRDAEGVAKIVPDSGNAKLRVSFFGPFYGDYWVLDRADDYSWSIVGEPSGTYLWILHRDAKLQKTVKDKLYARAAQLGYEMKLLRETQQ